MQVFLENARNLVNVLVRVLHKFNNEELVHWKPQWMCSFCDPPLATSVLFDQDEARLKGFTLCDIKKKFRSRLDLEEDSLQGSVKEYEIMHVPGRGHCNSHVQKR